jgi:hypothetical protein
LLGSEEAKRGRFGYFERSDIITEIKAAIAVLSFLWFVEG